MPLRNPFKKVAGNELGQDENSRAGSLNGTKGFEKTQVIGSSSSSALNIKGRNEEPNEYQMSGMSALRLTVFYNTRISKLIGSG